MKTAIKVIAVLFLLVVALIIGLVIFAFGAIDKGAQIAIEHGGTYALGVETSVESVDVALTQGTVELGKLTIANPEGFETAQFFILSNTFASVDLETINSDTIMVESVKLSGIDITLDKGNDPSNYNQILENLARFESDETGSADKSKEGKNVVIKSLILEDINIHIANMPGISLLAGDVAINIPRIELQNVGEQESMKAGDIFGLVVKTVMAAAVEAGGGIIPNDVLGELGNGLSGLSSLSDMGINAISDLDLDNVMGNVAQQIDNATQDAQKAVDDLANDAKNAVDGATSKLNDLFRNKKNDD